MNITVILPAAGVGRRFRAGGVASTSKIEFLLDRRPVFLHAVEALRSLAEVGQILLAVHPERVDEFRARWGDVLRDRGVDLIPGGLVERWETVRLALDRVDPEATHVAVHDAARPIPSAELLRRLVDHAQQYPAVIPGLAVRDTLKRVEVRAAADSAVSINRADEILGPTPETEMSGKPLQAVVETVPRSDLMAVQTPQIFRAELIMQAYAASGKDPAVMQTVTDDANLIERLGKSVMVIEGEATNLKVTTPEDIELIQAILSRRAGAIKTKRAVLDLFGDDDD